VFSCQYAEFGKIRDSGFINRMFRFYWFCLAKPNGPIFKPDCLVLTDLAYVSLILFFVILLSCASHNLCSHTQIVAHIGCIHIGGALLNFLKNVQNDISRPNLNSIQYAYI
jgi:hypothetical protein